MAGSGLSVVRGKVYRPDLSAQVRDFSGLNFGNITPTDIDGLIEYKNKCYILMETKLPGIELPYGQRLALERLCNDIRKPTILFVTEHSNREGEIDFANTIVRHYYFNGHWKNAPRTGAILREAINNYLEWVFSK